MHQESRWGEKSVDRGRGRVKGRASAGLNEIRARRRRKKTSAACCRGDNVPALKRWIGSGASPAVRAW
jgi:hypothetical protein